MYYTVAGYPPLTGDGGFTSPAIKSDTVGIRQAQQHLIDLGLWSVGRLDGQLTIDLWNAIGPLLKGTDWNRNWNWGRINAALAPMVKAKKQEEATSGAKTEAEIAKKNLEFIKQAEEAKGQLAAVRASVAPAASEGGLPIVPIVAAGGAALVILALVMRKNKTVPIVRPSLT
jgi:hypothetical protein